MPYSLKMASGVRNLISLSNDVISSSYKGLPIASHGSSIKSFLTSNPNLLTSDFQFPIAVVRESALNNNLRRMAKYCDEMKVVISPHVKTHMSPQIANKQIAHGAWALTVANFSQASVFLDFGFKRIFIANEIVDPVTIREISRLNMCEGIEIFFYVDSLQGFDLVQKALRESADERILLFIEIGMEGARAGLRDMNDVEPLIKAINQDSRFTIAGVAGFEGIVPVQDRSVAGLKELRNFCQRIVSAARILHPTLGGADVILSAGGSAYFDVVIEEFAKFGEGGRTVIRSGGYVAHDHGGYERTYAFSDEVAENRLIPAIEVWAQVISRPEPGLAILNLGKRDVGNDLENPFPVKRVERSSNQVHGFSGKIDRLNDQHGYLFFDADQRVEVGDLIGMGISHPCTTFDKWRYLPLVDDNYKVVDLIQTFF